jgi:hypothetical protein
MRIPRIARPTVHEALHSLTDDGARVGFLVEDARVGALVADLTGAVVVDLDGTATGLTGVARGDNVGDFVGPLTGADVGGLDGIFAGPLDTGAAVGGFEGTFIGALEGGFDGTLVGALEGGFDGTLVGALVGALLGALVGALVATAKVLARPGVPLLSMLPYVALVTNQLAGLFWDATFCDRLPLTGSADKL